MQITTIDFRALARRVFRCNFKYYFYRMSYVAVRCSLESVFFINRWIPMAHIAFCLKILRERERKREREREEREKESRDFHCGIS